MIFNNKRKINTNKEAIGSFLGRGVSMIYPNKELVMKMFASGERLSMYLGIDPTAPTLHIGHAIALRKLRDFQKLGHRAVLLIGDFTGMIGDPTGKASTRVRLTKKQVLENAKNYKKQASLFLDFSGKNKAEIVYNSKWLGKMNFENVLELCARMTVGQMLERDMFEERVKNNKPIYIHEFMYPLMQGYDSVFLKIDGEIGGNDQLFNMLVGRDLEKQILNKEKFVMTMKLLEDATGKKMGKSEGNMVALSDTPKEMYGKIMSWTDGMILPGFELCTDSSDEEIKQIANKLSAGENPKKIKEQLAKEIVSFYFGKEEGEKVQEEFNNTFADKKIPENIPEIKVVAGTLLVDALIQSNVLASKSEFTRLMNEGAISDENEEKVKDNKFAINKTTAFKVGKKRFIKIVIS